MIIPVKTTNRMRGASLCTHNRINPPPGALTSMQPRPAFEVWTRDQWFALGWHLHNGNDLFNFVLAWFGPDRTKGGRPGPIYVKSKHMIVSKAIPWAWSSLCGKGKKKVAVVFYAQNSAGLSRWGAVDFDAHSDDPVEAASQAEIVRQRAFDFFKAVLNLTGIHVILEASGRGWHVWLLSKEFRPCRDWTELLAGKLTECSIPVGECELFPPPATEANRHGKGLRAPGCWAPARQEPSLILYEGISPILARNERSVSLKEKKIISLFPFPLYSRLLSLLEEFTIKTVATRHNLLLKFTGQLFHQVGREMAEKFATEQFARCRCKTKADVAEHRVDFSDCWSGLHRKWLATLSPAERTAFDGLATDWASDAFRIIRSYAKKATADHLPDFPIVRDDLAARIGMTGPGAGQLVQRFCNEAAGILERTQECVPHKTAARYRWLLTPDIPTAAL